MRMEKLNIALAARESMTNTITRWSRRVVSPAGAKLRLPVLDTGENQRVYVCV